MTTLSHHLVFAGTASEPMSEDDAKRQVWMNDAIVSMVPTDGSRGLMHDVVVTFTVESHGPTLEFTLHTPQFARMGCNAARMECATKVALMVHDMITSNGDGL